MLHVNEVLAVQMEHPRHTSHEVTPISSIGNGRTLRACFADWAGPPKAPWKEALAASVSWRANQLRFIAAAHKIPTEVLADVPWMAQGSGGRSPGQRIVLVQHSAPPRIGRPPMVDLPPLERALESLAS